jgi:hypothetical protein
MNGHSAPFPSVNVVRAEPNDTGATGRGAGDGLKRPSWPASWLAVDSVQGEGELHGA